MKSLFIHVFEEENNFLYKLCFSSIGIFFIMDEFIIFYGAALLGTAIGSIFYIYYVTKSYLLMSSFDDFDNQSIEINVNLFKIYLIHRLILLRNLIG